MDNLFNAQVCFNGGNPDLFRVRNDVALKDLKDQLDEINQRLNPGDTRRWNKFGMNVHRLTQRGN